MLLGRFIFGVGGDSFFVGKSAIISSWFKGNEVAFAFGLSLSVGRVGAVLNGLIVPKVALSLGVPYSLYLGFGACLVSAIGTICLVLLDLWAEKKDHLAKVKVLEEDKFKLMDIFSLGKPFWLIVANCECVYSAVVTYFIISLGMIK